MDWTTIFSEQTSVLLPVGTIIMRVAIALVIGAVGVLLGRAFGKAARHVVEKLEIKKQLRKAGISFKPEMLAENIVKYVIYIGAFIAALNYLGITPVILNIIFGGLIIVVILAIFLSLKDFIPNVISGIYIISTNKIKKGDEIKVQDVSGKVKEISLTETTLISDGSKIIIPNSTIMKEQIESKRK